MKAAELIYIAVLYFLSYVCLNWADEHIQPKADGCVMADWYGGVHLFDKIYHMTALCGRLYNIFYIIKALYYAL